MRRSGRRAPALGGEHGDRLPARRAGRVGGAPDVHPLPRDEPRRCAAAGLRRPRFARTRRTSRGGRPRRCGGDPPGEPRQPLLRRERRARRGPRGGAGGERSSRTRPARRPARLSSTRRPSRDCAREGRDRLPRQHAALLAQPIRDGDRATCPRPRCRAPCGYHRDAGRRRLAPSPHRGGPTTAEPVPARRSGCLLRPATCENVPTSGPRGRSDFRRRWARPNGISRYRAKWHTQSRSCDYVVFRRPPRPENVGLYRSRSAITPVLRPAQAAHKLECAMWYRYHTRGWSQRCLRKGERRCSY